MLAVFLVSQPWIKTELTETDFEVSFSAKRRVASDWRHVFSGVILVPDSFSFFRTNHREPFMED